MVVLDQQETNKIVHDAYKGIQDILQGLKQIAKDYARENNTDLLVFMDNTQYNDEGYIYGPAALVYELDCADIPEDLYELRDYAKETVSSDYGLNRPLGRILSVGVEMNEDNECFVIKRDGTIKFIGDLFALGLMW